MKEVGLNQEAVPKSSVRPPVAAGKDKASNSVGTEGAIRPPRIGNCPHINRVHRSAKLEVTHASVNKGVVGTAAPGITRARGMAALIQFSNVVTLHTVHSLQKVHVIVEGLAAL